MKKVLFALALFSVFQFGFAQQAASKADVMKLINLANIYIEMYSEKDIKEMIAFYESPIGKKINGNMGDFTKKMMGASKEWGGSLQGIMMKYMKQ